MTPFDVIDPSYGMSIGQGFYDNYLSTRDDLLSYTKEYTTRYGFPITFIGHSLGASLVKIAAVDIYHNLNITDSVLYTYGSPYTGNKAFASHFNEILPYHFRITHNCDPVPHLPPKGSTLAHSGDEVYYNEDNTKYVICEKPEKSSQCANSCLLPVKFSDHVNYFNTPTTYMKL